MRITPTPVGNTDGHVLAVAGAQDHPHTCGEYAVEKFGVEFEQGSPPHLWGILGGRKVGEQVRGITPTPVGNTQVRGLLKLIERDHPHTCGEYKSIVSGHPYEKRITPTPVGNTFTKTLDYLGKKDHPHTCGEYQGLTFSPIPI